MDYESTDNSEKCYALEVVKHWNADFSLVSLPPSSPLITPDIIEEAIFASEQLRSLFIGPYLLYKSMRESGYKVSIDGHGADELLAGYRKYAKASLSDSLRQDTDSESFLNLQTIWEKIGKQCARERDYKEGGSHYSKLNLQQENYNDTHSGMLPWILETYDKIPMAHGIEVRSPFLDWRVVCYCLSLPNQAKVGGGFNKRILRDAMRGMVPEPIRTRLNKQGFMPPMHSFLREGSLKSLTLDTVHSQDFITSPLFDGKQFAKKIEDLYACKQEDQIFYGPYWSAVQTTLYFRQFNKIQTNDRGTSRP